MALTNVPVFIQTPKLGLSSLSNNASSYANLVTAYTGNTNGSKVVSMTCTSTDTINREVRIVLQRSATNYDLVSVQVPPSSGDDAAGANVSVNLLNSVALPGLPVDNDGQRYLFLQSSDILGAFSAANALTNGTKIDIVVVASDF